MGVAIQVVKDLLGHQDITTMMRYAHLSPADLRDAVEKLTPRKAVDPAPSKAEEKKDEPKS